MSEIWDFFALFYYLQKFSPALRAEFLLSTELPKKPRGVFIIYKNVPQKSTPTSFFLWFPLIRALALELVRYRHPPGCLSEIRDLKHNSRLKHILVDFADSEGKRVLKV